MVIQGGGAALTIKSVVSKPIKFVGIGEKLDAIDIFYPERSINCAESSFPVKIIYEFLTNNFRVIFYQFYIPCTRLQSCRHHLTLIFDKSFSAEFQWKIFYFFGIFFLQNTVFWSQNSEKLSIYMVL